MSLSSEFDSLLRRGGYHRLLGAVDPAVVRQIQDAVGRTANLGDAVRSMLEERNWRTDLVAAVAGLLSSRPADFVPLLWEAFDYGSGSRLNWR